MTLASFFLWVWVVYGSGCVLTFVWGCVRGWEIEILIPLAFLIFGSLAWWILYLFLYWATDTFSITVK